MKPEQIPPQDPRQEKFDFEGADKEAERQAKADAERAEEETLARQLWKDPNNNYGSLHDARNDAQQKLSVKRWEQRQEEKRRKEDKPN